MSDFFSKSHKAYISIENKALHLYNLQDIYSYALDYKVHYFLENYYCLKIQNKDAFEKYLTFWQYEALLNTLTHARKNTYFYKNLENKEIIHQAVFEDFEKKEDIEKKIKNLLQSLPFTESDDIKKDNMAFLALNQDEIDGIVSTETSGTSESPEIKKHNFNALTKKKQIYSSYKDFESTIQFFFFGMQYMLRNKEEKVALLISDTRVGSIGYLFEIAMQRLNIPCKTLGFSMDYTQIAKDLIDFKATCIVGIAWHILKLSAYFKENQIHHSIKTILLSGDTASQALRKEISQNLKSKVFNHYGNTEFGFAGAVECFENNALHLRALDLYIEIIDENLKQVEDGLFGEIVITSLTREAMPLIRYRTGDSGRIVTKKCSCGSYIPSIEVLGRTSQGIQITDEIFLHLSDFQNFFFNYTFFKCIDFDICLFTDIKSKQKILLVSLDIIKENKSLNVIDFNDKIQESIKRCQTDFLDYFRIDMPIFTLSKSETFKIEASEKIKNNCQSNKINSLCFCTQSDYQKIIHRKKSKNNSTLEKQDKNININTFDAFLQRKKNEEGPNNASAKKKILYLEEDLSYYFK